MLRMLQKTAARPGLPRIPLAAAAIAVLISLPFLWNGFITDDLLHRLILKGDSWLAPQDASPFNLFCFFSDTPSETERYRNTGNLCWWINEKIKVRFFRPLSSLTYMLDYALWPDSPLLMHAQSLLWLGLLVYASSFLYRAVFPAASVAGLATIFFALDFSHAIPAGWLANRHALIAGLLGILSVYCHNRWSERGWILGALLGPLFCALSLLAAEAGIATIAYIAAHALCIERGRLLPRLLRLMPYAATALLWRLAYSHLGYGAYGLMGFYVDPAIDPLLYARALFYRFPAYLLGQLAVPPLLFNLLIPSIMHKAGLVFMLLFLYMIVPLYRRDRVLRFGGAACFFPFSLHAVLIPQTAT